MPMRMSSQDAQIMKSGSARFPMKGAQCNASCAFYAFCANSKDFGTCERGFQLMNGDSRKLLERNLGKDSVKYIENSYGFIERAIQNNNFEGVEVVTRDLSQLREKAFPERIERETGFSYMAKCARGVQNTPSPEDTEPEPRSNTEFTRMLEASGKGSTTREQPRTTTQKTAIMTGLLRQVDESQFPDLCNPMACPPDFARHCRANRVENYGKPCIYKTLKNR